MERKLETPFDLIRNIRNHPVYRAALNYIDSIPTYVRILNCMFSDGVINTGRCFLVIVLTFDLVSKLFR